MRYDVAIIGSGISSLTCAALLAKKGKRVIVVEKYRKPGGYLHCFSRFGCDYDTGSHYVGSMGKGQSFHTLLSYLGCYDPKIFTPLNPSGFDVFKFPTFEFSMPAGHERAAETLTEIFPREREAIFKYFDLIRRIANSFPTYQFNENTDANSSIEYLSTPLNKIVEGLTSNQQLRCVFYSYCTLHCVHPEDTPFGFHAVMLDSLLRGPFGFREGGDALAKAFIKSIETKGSEVILRNEVDRFEIKDGHVTALHTSRGNRIEAEWFISGIHPKATFDLVGQENLSPAFIKRLSSITETVPFFGIYGACRKEPPLDIDRNYYAFASENPSDLEELRTPPREPQKIPKGIYYTRNNRSREAGKRGFHPLTIHAPAAYPWFSKWKDTRFADRPEEYHRLKKSIAENFISYTDRVFPGLGSSIDEYESSTALSNLFYNGSLEGSAYGIYHSISNTGVRGLGPRTHIKNLLITGQSTLFPGLLASCISGLRSAGHVLGIKPILRELRLHRESL